MARRHFAVLFSTLLALVFLSCGGDSESVLETTPSPSAPAETSAAQDITPTPRTSGTSTPAPSSSPEPATTQGALSPNGDRIAGYVRDLAETIGARAGGTAHEKAAADYLAQKLRSFGYEVELQEFPISNDSSRESVLSVTPGTPGRIDSVPFAGSAAGQVRGSFVAVPGLGEPGDFSAAARGSIVLIERGTVLFRDKIANAANAGAVGVVIYNNERGNFHGDLDGASAIPAVGISQEEGRRLLELISNGNLTAELNVEALTESLSRNVIARPPGAECETVSGGHYDSVPAAAGASDNASGTATVVELAAVLASRGQMGSNCFVFFGSEELGLNGSRAYVASLTQAQKARLKGMLNFDMVGFAASNWQLIGSASMQDRGATMATRLGMDFARSGQQAGGSDHASFINAGIPALFLYAGQDPEWHQPGDVAARMQPALLEQAAEFGVAMLESLNAGG